MDPFTVTTACIGTIAGISQLTSQITNFIRQLKDAQDDMQAVLAQLGAVAKGLEQLRDESTKINYPEDLQQRLIDMVRDCDTVVTSMQRVLDEASNATTARRLQWTLTGKNNMTKLSSRLEAHKTAVVVAVSVASLCLNTGLKSNTDQILRETAALHQQMALMQLQMTTLRQSDSTENVVMQRFMEETTSYAESVIEHHDLASELVLEQAEDRQELRQQPPLIPPHDSALEDTKGPLGLTTIHKPLGEVVADMIFVHGCGGGSRKTWSKNEDPALFWPGEWLSNEPQFRNVRIHTFGYSDNEKSSNLDVPDFAKSLLECFTSAPGIPHKSQTPILLVCHSTGGLVANKAFLLSR